jgi:hypothetical protein
MSPERVGRGNLSWRSTGMSLANVSYLFGPKLTLFAKVSYLAASGTKPLNQMIRVHRES